MDQHIHYKVWNYEWVGRSAGRQQFVGWGSTPSFSSGPVITRRLGQVGRSALIWAYIYIAKYEYGVGRQVCRSAPVYWPGSTPSHRYKDQKHNSREVGRSALIWVYIYITKYE